MRRTLAALILATILVSATGCERKMISLPGAASMMQFASKAEDGFGGGGAASPQHYVEEHHAFEIITSESDLRKSWESVVAFCATIQCEILSSSITARTADSAPSGHIFVRVAPPDLGKLLGEIQKLGKIAQHTTERDDRTAAVVDTEARLKNLAAFRDNLRAMLTKPSATVKDLIEIQQQLTETQSQLDSETAKRRILANETEKITVAFSFRIKEPRGGGQGLMQIWDALHDSGSVLAGSTASLITVVVAIIPWLILIMLALWLLRKTWRKLRRGRVPSQSPSKATP
jgi:hypothetical protein